MDFTKRASEHLAKLLQEYDESGLCACVGAKKSAQDQLDFTLDFVFLNAGVSYVSLELTNGCKLLCRESEVDFLQDIIFDYQPGGLNAGWRALPAKELEKY